MNITHLIRKGHLEPVTQTDRHGVTIITGWRRKKSSRKRGQFALKKPYPWIDRKAIADGKALTPGAQIILNERKRQISAEGYDAAHDDAHTSGQLATAAKCYVTAPEGREMCGAVPSAWPWEPQWWKPSPDRVRDLAKAGALYMAEAARLKRAGNVEASSAVEGLATGCAKLIDDIYGV
jgi:hypothetical protein